MSEKFTAFITKYALTEGIKEMSVTDCFDIFPDTVSSDDSGERQYFNGPDWYRERKIAILRAEYMRLSEIESLKKQISKLEKLNFMGGNDV